MTHEQQPTPETDAAASIRVSVVIPVFRPREGFDELIASLDAQTLAQDRFEVLLCDDGSGPETQALLQEVARTRPNVRVLDLPHSGWPGTPRNHGIDAARGDFVQFVDQDDRLTPEALERLVAYADEHGSDVVVGKEVGEGRDIPRRIFRADVPDARLGRDPLLQMLTPHKMFRTAFLREHGIRFPSGRVRLEDHMFVMRAYFAADVISILASVPCYVWVQRAGSASSSRIDPPTYYPHLETVLDIVDEHVEAGPDRDRLLRHWLRGKILQRLAGPQMLRYPAAYRELLLDVVTPIVERRFGPGVDAGLAVPHRIRVALLRAGRRDALLALARFESEQQVRAEVTSATWSRGGGLHLRMQLAFAGAQVESEDVAEDAEPAPATTEAALRRWVSSGWLADAPADVVDLVEAHGEDRLELLLRRDGAADRRVVAGTVDASGRVAVAIDPLRLFAQDDDASTATLVACVRRAAWTFETTLAIDDAVATAVGASPLLAGRSTTVATEDGALVLRRAEAGRLRDAAGRTARRVRRRLGA
ncbi:hypothetical protein GCM10009846_25660 [Agrococcus versicolor]|uniref:Glycosyltransferase 2-like domain-containing protein n=1 Tax=Agrococcus versicolor TaxID=501482 RepID=A0ABN3AWN0_9MICO